MNSERLINFLNPESRKEIGNLDLKIIPHGLSSDFQDYHWLGVQQPQFRITYDQMRRYAESNAWIESIITAIIDFIGSCNWRVVPKDPYISLMKTDEEMQYCRYFLEQLFDLQNGTFMNLHDVLKAVVRDLLVYDAGCIEVVRYDGDTKLGGDFKKSDRKGRIIGLVARDAATIYIDHDEHGIVRRYIQAGLRGRQTMPWAEENVMFNMDIGGVFTVFDRHDIIYMKLHPKSSSCYGSPPILALLQAIQADTSADLNITKFMATGGVVPGFLAVDERIDPNISKRFEDAFLRMQRAGARQLPIISGAGDTKYIPIAATSREMEQNQLQNYYRQKLCAMYKVPPHILGIVDGVNRGIAFAQNDQFQAGAITPIKVYLENTITQRIVEEFSNKLRFELIEPPAADFNTRFQKASSLKQVGAISEEQFFVRIGEEPPDKQTPEGMQIQVGLESAKLDLEIKKENLRKLRNDIKTQEIGQQTQEFGLEQQKQQMEQQSQMQEQQAQQQQQQAQQQQQVGPRGQGTPVFDALEQKQEPMKKAMGLLETVHPALKSMMRGSIASTGKPMVGSPKDDLIGESKDKKRYKDPKRQEYLHDRRRRKDVREQEVDNIYKTYDPTKTVEGV